MDKSGWFGVILAATGVSAQKPVVPAPRSLDRAMTFSDGKPVLGLPADLAHHPGPCSSDGLTYFDASDTTGMSRALDMYSVSATGEVLHLSRTVPVEFTHVTSEDFFPGDLNLVTLIEADKRDDAGGTPRDTQYYLGTSDHNGQGIRLETLDLKFKPLKVAQFSSGEFLVLGWEEANQLPELAVLKEDGTVRRFIDFDERPMVSDKPMPHETETLDSLRGAAMVPFGGSILLTYPGTVKPMRMMTPSGSLRFVTLAYPAGYRLHDVLVGSNFFTIVARLQEMPEAETAAKSDDSAPPRQRIFEFNGQTGARLREFTFDNVPVSAVSCAANKSLEAVFEQPVGDDNKATQLVVSTVKR